MSDSFISIREVGRFEHVVFLGTHNAGQFRSKIENWLPKLDLSGAALLVSDNQSTDSTLTWLKPLLENLSIPVCLISQPKNIGGYGNLISRAVELESTLWITTLHQDDSYSHDHVTRHKRVIEKSAVDLGMICSESRSITPQGERINFPRGHWFLEGAWDPVKVFLAHLKNHSFPFSGATFSRQLLLGFPIPWYSTAFPDTELVMKMVMDYRVEFAAGISVDYLENPESESHSLDESHRDFGAFQALLRVFSHPNYGRLCRSIQINHLESFFDSLEDGINARFTDSILRNLMRQAAFELTSQHLPMSPELATRLAKGYSTVGDRRALEALESAGAALIQEKDHWAGSQMEPAKRSEVPARQALLAFTRLFPRSLVRLASLLLMKTTFGKRNFKGWDFDWKSR